MPIYEYKCASCGVFEEKQKITDPALQQCPYCGAPVKRLISPVCVIYKSPGFYVTDNRSNNYTERNNENKKPQEKDKTDKTNKDKSETAAS